MQQEGVPDFTEKVVAVFLKGLAPNASSYGWTIMCPRFEEQGGRLFLVGKPARDHFPEPLFSDEATVCVAWEEVSSYLLFEAEAYKRSAIAFPVPRRRPKWFGRFRRIGSR